jgi:hypothetical protein
VNAVDREPTGITWYVDGSEKRHIDAKDKAAEIPDEPLTFRANLSVSNPKPGQAQAMPPDGVMVVIRSIDFYQAE